MRGVVRIGLIGWFGVHNIGDELALHVVREGLRQRLHCEIDTLSTARRLTAHDYGLTAVRDRPDACFWAQYDALCWGPGGMLPGAPRLLRGYLPPLDIPQAIVSSSWREDDETMLPLLRRCRLAWTRRKLSPLATGPRIIVAPDCAYGLRVLPVRRRESWTIIVCPSARCPTRGQERLRLLTEAAMIEGYKVVFYAAAASPGDMDIVFCARLAEQTGAEYYQDVPTWQEALETFRGARWW